MKKNVACCVPALLLLSCMIYCANKDNTRPKDQLIMAIHAVSHLPVVEWNGSITDIKSFYEVFYYKDIIMYKFIYKFDSTVNGEMLLEESRNRFFVFHKDSLFGYDYYPVASNNWTDGRLSVDSILKARSFRNNKLDSLLNFEIDSSYVDAQDIFVKIYNLPASKEYGERFTIYFYYTKELKAIPETFSEKMDNVKDMKLFKVRIVGHGMYYEPGKMNFPERESSYEMKEIPVENSEEILSYFNRYKKEHLQN